MAHDAFDALGVEPSFALDLPAIERRHRELSRALHPDRHAGAAPAARRAAVERAMQVNEAWRVLRDPVRRAEALCRRLGIAVGEGREPPASPALLMDVLEQREALAEARAARLAPQVERLAESMTARETLVLERLGAAFAAPDPAAVLAALGELRYVRRFLDEVGATLDDLG